RDRGFEEGEVLTHQPLDRGAIEYIGVVLDAQLAGDFAVDGEAELELGAAPIEFDRLPCEAVEFQTMHGGVCDVEKYLYQRRTASISALSDFLDEPVEGN